MTFKEFVKELKEIDKHLFFMYDNANYWGIYYNTDLSDQFGEFPIYYSSNCTFTYKNCRKYIPNKINALRMLLYRFYDGLLRGDKWDKETLYLNIKTIGVTLGIQERNNKPLCIYDEDDWNGKNHKVVIYDFSRKLFTPDCISLFLEKHNNDILNFLRLQDVINYYWESTDSETIPEDNTDYANHKDEIDKVAEQIKYVPMVNPFAKYTEKLATVLKAKNVAYGDSFAQSVDDYGLKVIGIRLSDKYNRIKHLVNNSELKENDESLEDTSLDTAGYAILALKYLKEHENEEIKR